MDEQTIQGAAAPPGKAPAPAAAWPRAVPDWPPWTAPVVLISGLGIALVAAALIDIPAAALGAKVTGENLPGGLVLADTVAQDLAFVFAAVVFAHIGGRAVRAWMFGLRAPRVSWWVVFGLIATLGVGVIVFAGVWSEIFHPGKEKLLETLGANEGALLLTLSALLTCVLAPMCEEFLFRGYFFTALRNWRGTLPAALITGVVFGGVHAGSAPLADLAPLAVLGFGLCLLYRYTASLYPCIIAHSLNNCVAFAALEGWTFGQGALLAAGALALLWLVWLALTVVGVISPEPPAIGPSA
ncbi:MAG TPA: CPBP family intramembrane glutamic endopeptidase [Solirubrobacteraceae bacterium]|nr:CPBP family intramembrane glutamic endopeptidase [Solirubrobacteraceae bacterium]